MNSKTAKKLRKMAKGLAVIAEQSGTKISEREIVVDPDQYIKEGMPLVNKKESLRGIVRKLKKDLKQQSY